MASLFEADIASLKGVGPKRAELFRKLGAPTVGDLLRLYPRAYEDWRDAVTWAGNSEEAATRCPSAIHS